MLETRSIRRRWVRCWWPLVISLLAVGSRPAEAGVVAAGERVALAPIQQVAGDTTPPAAVPAEPSRDVPAPAAPAAGAEAPAVRVPAAATTETERAAPARRRTRLPSQRPAGAVGVRAPGVATAAPSPTQQAADVDSLLATVQARFQVYPLREGLLLLPKYEAPSVQSVQVTAGTVAVNGRMVAGREIVTLLGEDAPLVLRLAYVPQDQLVQRFSRAGGASGDTLAPGGAQPTGTIARADAAGAQGEPGAAAGAGEEAGQAGARAGAAGEEPGEADTDEDEEPDYFDQHEDIVRMGGDVTVEEGETVEGDVVAMGGNVDIAGHVLGEAVVMGGNMRVRDTGRIEGDAVVLGGNLERDPGAYIGGEVKNVAVSVPFLMARNFTWDTGGMVSGVVGLLVTLFWIALLLILGAIFLLFAERGVERVETNVRSSALKAGLVGFLAQVLFLPVYVVGLVLLVITIIGIPIAVLWAVGFFIVAFVAALFGLTAIAKAVGSGFAARMDRPLHSSHVAVLVGLLLLFLPMLLHSLFHFGPGLMDVFAMFFFVIGIVVLYLAFTIGFGAVILTRFGTRTSWSGQPPEGSTTVPPAFPAPPAPAPGRAPVTPSIQPALPGADTAAESGGLGLPGRSATAVLPEAVEGEPSGRYEPPT